MACWIEFIPVSKTNKALVIANCVVTMIACLGHLSNTIVLAYTLRLHDAAKNRQRDIESHNVFQTVAPHYVTPFTNMEVQRSQVESLEQPPMYVTGFESSQSMKTLE